MVVFFNAGLVAIIFAVIAALVIIGYNMGVEGLATILTNNPEKVILICTAVFFVFSFILCGINYVPEGEETKARRFFWTIPYTAALSAPTIYNIFQVIHAVNYLHETMDIVLRVIFFIVPILIIVALIIVCIITYIIGLWPLLLRFRLSEKLSIGGEQLLKGICFTYIPIVYFMVCYMVASGNIIYILD